MSSRDRLVSLLPGARVLAAGLGFPEGPIALDDASVLFVEVAAGSLSRVAPDGDVVRVATLGGGPNGAAIGPDGAVYVCNNGGLGFTVSPRRGWLFPGHAANDHRGGSIQRVDLGSGEVSTLYEAAAGHRLRAPNDLVFDGDGGFWFTDHGTVRGRARDLGGLYWARPDGTEIREVVHGLETPNGVGLSPDGRRLYVAETLTRSIWSWDVIGPGELDIAPQRARAGAAFVYALGDERVFDSLAIDDRGNVCVGALGRSAGIAVVSPAGELLNVHDMPDPFPTNLCFRSSGQSVIVTLSATGQILELPWDTGGAPLAYRA